MMSLAPEYSAKFPDDKATGESALKRSLLRARSWLAVKALRIGRSAKRAFTRHPAETRETYLQHLWFTTKTSSKFAYICAVLFVHGVFPFTFTRTASKQIEKVYMLMRSRIPEARREALKAEYDI